MVEVGPNIFLTIFSPPEAFCPVLCPILSLVYMYVFSFDYHYLQGNIVFETGLNFYDEKILFFLERFRSWTATRSC